ncbi:asparagine synthase (glutamine-hydrolyzing) [Pedobacter sp. MR22-3]|uniref:asparagine synthase (glutamine-hydrolyzing) n=1 Tax=Pedobacter sp. MR22-3 TaxID=2994552 RepID=UPI002246F218|nr:asparagine synthase (glutamine-hydrolyzing) [Pedobacter sp. MR22-3]MCX2584716.1 asparagine synthase (glutamine-hydrolyzing) [Pedobacter sp. MR22-3]
MCGICGFVKYNEIINEEDGLIIQKMNKKLIHRGPDAQDTVLIGRLAFGFSRLSIIGLENGMQPIMNEDDRLMLICNGEIFNYIELKESLMSKGHHFKTSSDVEVILHMYEEYGTEFLNELNGQFAFALYDKKEELLFCARDQMGIIPFFYTVVDDCFIFGSEIKSILEHPAVVKEVDLVGLDQIFTFAGLISPRTMFKNINSLENGHLLLIDRKGNITKQEYWDLIYPEKEEIVEPNPEVYYTDQLERLFENSINLRLRTDVPYGFYLSGGLDSSAIAMKINQLYPEVQNDAFSIDFVESELSETVYQNIIAQKSNSTLNKKTFYSSDISDRLRLSIYHSECPLKETYNTASLSLSELVKSKGIKVILSGEGADELFAGYVGYRFDRLRSMNLVQNPTNSIEKELRISLWGDEDFFYERNFSEFDEVKRSLYSSELNSIYEEINCINHFVIDKSKLQNRDILHKRSYIDYKLRLVDHLVSDHGDRMALANSIEVRYPFLDKNLVEFSREIPVDLKLNELTEKYIIKKMAERFVPSSVVEREKFGFVAPGSAYLLGRDIDYINEILSYDVIKKQGFFNPDQVELLKKQYSEEGFSINVPFESDLLITVITFGIFLNEFF